MEKEPSNYLKYTGLAFQMIGIICICAFLGHKADTHFQHSTQWITALSCIIGVCLSIYQVIRQLK
ncbi:MAG: AtpZ/AtpI family protein [Pedobacter sp.]|nr:MAG: AtpZ/AtpI family protein [Pedobacter sp.]